MQSVDMTADNIEKIGTLFPNCITETADEIGEFDVDGNRLFKNTETNGCFHSDWYSMMYSA